MALQQIPGQQGYIATKYASMEGRSLGKLTASNHLSSISLSEPSKYDKDIIDIYTQNSLFSNDFMDMINKSDPYYIRSNSDSWQWGVTSVYQYAKVIAVPESTALNPTPGIDGQEFELVFDKAFQINDVITANRMYGDDLQITSDPLPWPGGGKLHRVTLNNGTSANTQWLTEGIEYEKINNLVGEFDQELSGLPELADKIIMFDSLSSGYGVQHHITKWADQRVLRDKDGKALDVMVYGQYGRNQKGERKLLDVRWEPYVEMLARQEMLSLKVKRMIWGKGGTAQTRGSRQEVKKALEGVYHKIRNNGHLARYPRGTFNLNMLRDIFGDLFYRRTSIQNRRVKLFTNEAGMRLFTQATKDDLLASGLTVLADNRFIEGSGLNMMTKYGFDRMYSMETGVVEVSHLTELDLPQLNSEFGQNKMSTPIFLVFDVTSPDGGLQNNIREVRQEGAPSMTYGYIDGRQHHLGHGASQGMSSASMDPGYTMWFEDRADTFIEDLSKTVLIEEIPQY